MARLYIKTLWSSYYNVVLLSTLTSKMSTKIKYSSDKIYYKVYKIYIQRLQINICKISKHEIGTLIISLLPTVMCAL